MSARWRLFTSCGSISRPNVESFCASQRIKSAYSPTLLPSTRQSTRVKSHARLSSSAAATEASQESSESSQGETIYSEISGAEESFNASSVKMVKTLMALRASQSNPKCPQALPSSERKASTRASSPSRLRPSSMVSSKRGRPSRAAKLEALKVEDREQWKEVQSSKSYPSSSGLPPIPYTRRIEGVLQPLHKPVLEDLVSPSEHRPIATLAHGLDRVLFNPGVYWLQDPRSRVYNFTTYLESIPNVKEFAFERLPGFISSSRDEDLWTLAKREGRTFAGSTSSLTGLLSHIYFLVSADKTVNLDNLSLHYRLKRFDTRFDFTPSQRMPVGIVMKYRDGVYTIDKDSMYPWEDEKNVLLYLGTLLEKFLTTPPEKFRTLMRSYPAPEADAEPPKREAYRYAKSARFVMRSQLDCHDQRLPGTGIFDIKTRAALPTRMDILNYAETAGYLIKKLHGPYESFEREYYDLVRSAFLKYSFQARIGNMDGVLVAYHNTARIFGFQYVPLEEMELRLYGAQNRGEEVFEKCLGLLENVLEEIVLCFPQQSVKCFVEKQEHSSRLWVWVSPADWDEKTQGPPHVYRLDVCAKSFHGSNYVSSSCAITGSPGDDPWHLHWTIFRSSESQENILHQLAASKERQVRAYSLPSGVAMEEMDAFWKTELRFRDTDGEVAPFDPARFKQPSKNVQLLRQLSRQGREETERRKAEDMGKAPVVWGDPEKFVEEHETGELAALNVSNSEGDDAGELEGASDGQVVHLEVARAMEILQAEDPSQSTDARDMELFDVEEDPITEPDSPHDFFKIEQEKLTDVKLGFDDDPSIVRTASASCGKAWKEPLTESKNEADKVQEMELNPKSNRKSKQEESSQSSKPKPNQKKETDERAVSSDATDLEVEVAPDLSDTIETQATTEEAVAEKTTAESDP